MSTIYKTKGELTTVAGTAAATVRASHSIVMWLFVEAATSSTSFDVKLTDIFGNDIYIRNDEVGRISREITIPSYGNWTITIENASADEEFSYLLAFNEV